jgi:predicted dehydrogenase
MVKVGFVGCGGMQAVHYERLAAINDVKMVGHCDPDYARAEAAAERFGGKAFTDYEALYDKARPDAVYIAVPPFAHTGMEEAAAERGIHLFIEKPVAIERPTAKRIAVAIRSAKIITSVGYCFRYYDTVAMARRFLKGKAISLINGTWCGGMPDVWWWRQMNKSGGQVVEQTTHMFDLIRYLCGEVDEVFAVGSTGCMTRVKNYDVHDSSVVSFRTKAGATGVVSSSCVANNGGKVGVEIVTPEATVNIEAGKLSIKEGAILTEYAPTVDMYTEENIAFVEAVRTGRRNKIRSSYPDAVKTALVTYAANESMETGLPVKP